MIFDTEFFLVHTMRGECVIFVADRGVKVHYFDAEFFLCSHNGVELLDFFVFDSAGTIHDFCY